MTSLSSDEVRYRRSCHLIEAAFGDEIVALDRQSGRCISFSDVATDVWKMIKEPKSLNELVDELGVKYDVEETECRRDVSKLLIECERLGLVDTTSSN